MVRSLLVGLFVFFIFIPTIQAADKADHRELLSKHYRLEKPDGAGPFPAVMLIPGCSGFDAEFQKEYYDSVQRQLVELGFVTLRVNYQAVRNVHTCWPSVSTEDIAGDILIAAEYLREQPFVKKKAINVLGWSYGVAGALQALIPVGSREPVQVNGVIAYYPDCEHSQKWKTKVTVPVLVLVGTIDDVTPFWQCEELFGDISKRPNLTVRKYDNAHHSFDNSTLPAEKQYVFGTLGYNEVAAKSAWMEVTRFLRK